MIYTYYIMTAIQRNIGMKPNIMSGLSLADVENISSYFEAISKKDINKCAQIQAKMPKILFDDVCKAT